ncbi:MAG: c-type cytochrome [Wenzhouxiangellaceae bacterium]
MNMKFSYKLAGFGFAAVFGLAGVVMADANDACIACHGDDGTSNDPKVPVIAGASDFYLESQLFLFADGDRPCVEDFFAAKEDVDLANHCVALEGFSEDEKVELAEYYSGKPFVAPAQEIDAALADQGKSIHERTCARCHSNDGGLALDDAGILAGQQKHYLVHQLTAYRDGERWVPDGKPDMDYTDEQIQALAEHYARAGQ